MNPQQVRRWRQLVGLTQVEAANLLGVKQATISRWERGLDSPSEKMAKRLRETVEKTSSPEIEIERSLIKRVPGFHMLFDLDGAKLLSMSEHHRAMWPSFDKMIDAFLIDHMIGQSREIFENQEVLSSAKKGEVVMAVGWAEEHTELVSGYKFSHHWIARTKRIGGKTLFELSFDYSQTEKIDTKLITRDELLSR